MTENKTQLTQKRLLSVADVQNLSGLGRTYIYSLIANKSLPAKKIGRLTFILLEDFEKFIIGLESYPVKKGGNHD